MPSHWLILKGRITFDNVSFSYEPDKPVLTDINLDVEPGQTIALVGPTGAGKTTIISLLSRFYDVSEGTICIDGHDIRTVQQDSIRQQLGIVLQDTFLFSGTVLENIRYGRLDATEDEIIEAAKLANAQPRLFACFHEAIKQKFQKKAIILVRVNANSWQLHVRSWLILVF